MPNKPEELKWYRLSVRDKFMLTGMLSGILAYEFVQRHFHPEPPFLWAVTPALMVVGAVIGELVKRNRARSA